MNYVNILPESSLLETTAPPYVGALVRQEGMESCILAAIGNGALLGYALFSHPAGSSKDVWLEYLYTREDIRETGVATGLLDYGSEYMKKKGVANILCRMYLKFGEAKDAVQFFLHRDFIPLSLNGRLLAYRYRDMTDSGFFDIIGRNRKKLPPSVSAAEAGKKSLNALLAKQRETGFSFENKDLEAGCSRFMKDGEEIEAAMIAKVIGDKTLYAESPYMTPKARKKNLFPILFSDVVAEAKKSFEDDFLILVSLNDDSAYYGMMQLFNPPEREYLEQVYMRCLMLEKGKKK